MTVRNDKFSKASLTLYACGTIPVIWSALLLAPYVDDGLVALIRYGGAALNDPFHIVLCEDSLKAVVLWAGDRHIPLHRPQLSQAGGTRLCQMGSAEAGKSEIRR